MTELLSYVLAGITAILVTAAVVVLCALLGAGMGRRDL